MPKISIITVSYNAAATIRSTIQSVVNQTFPDIEYIIIDGGSKDGTVEIIREFQSRIAYWCSEKDAGIYDAMNKGLEKASGDWLFFLGSDDELMSEDIIEKVAEGFTRQEHIYYGNVFWKNTRRLYPGGTIGRTRLALKNFAHQALFYPKGIYKKYRYELQYRLFADHVYNIKLYSEYGERFEYFSHVVTLYNDAGASSHGGDAAFDKDRVKIAAIYLGRVPAIYLYSLLLLGKMKRMLLKRK